MPEDSFEMRARGSYHPGSSFPSTPRCGKVPRIRTTLVSQGTREHASAWATLSPLRNTLRGISQLCEFLFFNLTFEQRMCPLQLAIRIPQVSAAGRRLPAAAARGPTWCRPLRQAAASHQRSKFEARGEGRTVKWPLGSQQPQRAMTSLPLPQPTDWGKGALGREEGRPVPGSPLRTAPSCTAPATSRHVSRQRPGPAPPPPAPAPARDPQRPLPRPVAVPLPPGPGPRPGRTVRSWGDPARANPGPEEAARPITRARRT